MILNTIKQSNLVKFILAFIAGIGLVRLYKFVAEVELNEEEDYHIYEEEHDHPLFV